MESVTATIDTQKEVRNLLQDKADAQSDLGTIAIALAGSIHEADINTNTKLEMLRLVRSWSDYAHQQEIAPDEPFAIRYHAAQFAAREFGEVKSFEPLQEVPLSTHHQNGETLEATLTAHTPAPLLSDPEVAIIGGAARLALKLHAGVDVSSEVPLNDIDAVISTDCGDVAHKADTYGIDLTGTKIIDGNIDYAIGNLVTNFDCTMNQVALHNGRLLHSAQALEDIRQGNIRLIAKNDPLFGSEGVVLPDGKVYLNRVGFYRGLSFLLRGKGSQLIVSEQNIEREKDSIGRYWQIMLYVKLMTIKDEEARYRAIGNWHELATRLEVTNSDTPQAFRDELAELYPETQGASRRTFDSMGQARWIISRLIGESTKRIMSSDAFHPPQSYTEANLRLADSFPDYDYDSFIKTA